MFSISDMLLSPVAPGNCFNFSIVCEYRDFSCTSLRQQNRANPYGDRIQSLCNLHRPVPTAIVPTPKESSKRPNTGFVGTPYQIHFFFNLKETLNVLSIG